MLTHVSDTLIKYEFPKDCVKDVLDATRSLLDNGVCDLARPYLTDFDCDLAEIAYKVELLANKIGLNVYLAHLAFYLILSKRLKEYYLERNLPLDSYDGIILDIKYKNEECKLVQGVWGTFVYGWFVGFFKLQRFCFGRLQCELLPFGKLFGKFNTDALPPDTPVINVHIPRSGERLDKELVQASYKKASKFFAPRLNGRPVIFSCESWLFYPKNAEILNPKSNLSQFVADYQLITHGTYKDYSELWRLFDVKFDGNPDHLPQDSSLRRAYASWVKQGLPIGYGVGLFYYKEV